MPSLIKALIEQNAVNSDTIITAEYHAQDLFGRIYSKIGDFKVKKITKTFDEPVLHVYKLSDSSAVFHMNSQSITAIDGMDLTRYADAYNLCLDGSQKKIGRKRGRKPKSSDSLDC